MRRYPARIRNFFEDDEATSAQPAATSCYNGEEEAEPIPLPQSAVAPTARHAARASSDGVTKQIANLSRRRVTSGSDSSASIEDVIACSTFPNPAHGDALPRGGGGGPSEEYVSLRQLQASVLEAERDVRRLRALTVKAVWHALTQPLAAVQGLQKTGRGGAAAPSGKTPRTGVHRSHEAGKVSTSSTTAFSADLVGFCNEKPFLPPDRYPSLPPVTESSDHLRLNLSRALSAARHAGLLEKQRVWLQQRHSSSAVAAGPVDKLDGAAASPSARQTALQRISSLSTVQRATTKPSAAVATAARSVYEAKEERVQSSLSMVILRVAKDRAVATLFLRQLRLDTYQRHQLREEVALRYEYYLRRRVLREWCVCARRQHVWHQQLLRRVVAHWMHYHRNRQALHERLCGWRRQLRQRSRAFAAVQRARLARCWHRWTRAFTWQRERSGLYETAAEFAKTRVKQRVGLHGLGGVSEEHELLALLHGAPLATASGGVVATPVGHRLALQRLFHMWKVRTERRLMMHLAGWHRVQCVRRRVVRIVCGRARALALRVHRQRKEADRAAPAELLDAHADAVARDAPPPRAPVRVYSTNPVRSELRKYKLSVASRIAHAGQIRSCFQRWRSRCQQRCADHYRSQRVRAGVVRRWLYALTTRHQQQQWKVLVMVRWRVAAQRRRDIVVALRAHAFVLLRRTFGVWCRHFTFRVTRSDLQQRSCLRHWRERAAVSAGVPVLRRAKLHRLLRRWHTCTQKRVNTRANLYVADTLRETGLLLGCVRRWRYRAVEHRRIRLAWEVFVELRREKMCRQCFTVWQHRTFGPAVTQPSDRHGAGVSSSAMSLLI